MRTSTKTLLGAVAVAIAAAVVRGRALSAVGRLRKLVRRRLSVDRVVEDNVRDKLDEVTPRARALHTRADRGSVVLTGPVLTEERARIVREAAVVEGVDSVTDLMTEHRRGVEVEIATVAASRGRRLEWTPAFVGATALVALLALRAARLSRA